ncbi:uncharacterized protein LOC142631429 [Castanea sativa]|uniref:uncharacterized protein LOC142631429 n=1 Tax=Castanea sativa TaxID=21020 RepID=UPI003F6509EC
MEAKLEEDKGFEVLRRCGFWNGWEVPRVGLNGGLLLGWMPEHNLLIQHSSKNMIPANLLDHKGTPLSITFFYGHLELAKRKDVWLELLQIRKIALPNWLCIGDFDQVLNDEDKFTFHSNSIAGADLFQQTLNDLELCALKAKCQNFTWMNRREDEYFVMERLDRAFASVEWINSYPQYALHNHQIIRSDHGSILLGFEVQLPFRRRPFRLERMWSTYEDCGDVVKSEWDANTTGSRAFNLQYKINNVKRTFSEWNWRVFGKVEREIKDKQKILQTLKNSVQTLMDVRNEKILREDQENLMDGEEIKWAQKARSNWIIQDDRNTKYF